MRLYSRLEAPKLMRIPRRCFVALSWFRSWAWLTVVTTPIACLNENIFKTNKVSAVTTRKSSPFVIHREFDLSPKGNPTLGELNCQRRLINCLQEAVSQFAMDLHRCANNFIGLRFHPESVKICAICGQTFTLEPHAVRSLGPDAPKSGRGRLFQSDHSLCSLNKWGGED